MDRPASPIILDSSWGRMEVEGLGEGKDFKLWPGGGRLWDWRETGTEHDPGIQPADVAELLDWGAEIIVISRGRELRLQTASSTLNELAGHGVAMRQEETQAAIDTYNELARRGLKVGGLSTRPADPRLEPADQRQGLLATRAPTALPSSREAVTIRRDEPG